MRRTSNLLAACALAIPSAAAAIAWPVSGVLLDDQDRPVDAPVTATFRLWNQPTGGTALWTGADCALDVRAGRWATLLGGTGGCGASIPVELTQSTLYLEASIGTVALAPRLLLSPVPRAAEASHAQDADTLGGIPPAQFALKTDLTPLATRAELLSIDAQRLTGTVASARLSGTYSESVALTNPGNQFAGNASGLSNIPASALVGTLPSTRLSGTYSESVSLTNPANQFAGNASGLSNIPASALVGTLPSARLSGTYSESVSLTNPANQFAGNASGLSNIPASALVGQVPAASLPSFSASTLTGTLSYAQLPSTVARTDQANTFSSTSNLFAGRLDGTVRLGADTATCDAAREGSLRYNSKKVEFCDGSAWKPIYSTPDGSTREQSASSCQAVRNTGVVSDGVRWIDPSGGSTADAFQVWCDMTTDGGGWTTVASISSADGNNRWPYYAALWTDTSTLNETNFSVTSDKQDRKFASYSQVPFSQVMISVADRSRYMVLHELQGVSGKSYASFREMQASGDLWMYGNRKTSAGSGMWQQPSWGFKNVETVSDQCINSRIAACRQTYVGHTGGGGLIGLSCSGGSGNNTDLSANSQWGTNQYACVTSGMEPQNFTVDGEDYYVISVR